MKRALSFASCLLVLAGLLSFTLPATGQDVTAAIVGTVTDPSGAPINGATVTATDTERGTVWTAKTNDTGAYNLTRIPIGTYRLQVSAQGFQVTNFPPFTLVLNQTARLDAQMKMGSVSEAVEVTGAAPVLQTESAEVSTLINANTNVSLPLASRNYLQLTLLAPGVTNVDPDGMRSPQTMLNSGRPYINGNREQANEILLDGILNSEDKNNETAYTPSVDAIQEFNLITQNAGAEFGNYQGGIVSSTIKSGTNRFHGNVYEFFRNDALNANLASSSWSEGVSNGQPGFNAQGVANKPELRYNQFGATLGGPIIKNKLFFFADYQGQRMVSAGATAAQLLTSRARNGDFGQLCLTGFSSGVCNDRSSFYNTLTGANDAQVATNQLVMPNPAATVTCKLPSTATAPLATTYYLNPAQRPACAGPNPTPIGSNNLAAAGFTINPVAKNLFGMTKYYPLPQIDSLNNNNYTYNSGFNLNNNQGDLKIDFVPSQKDHVFGRWSQMDLVQPTFTGCVFCNNFTGGASGAEGSDQPVRNAALDWTHTITSNLLNDARVGFNAVVFNQSLTPTSSLGSVSQQLGIQGGNAQGPGLVEIDIAGAGPTANANLGLRNLVQEFHSTQAQAEDNLIWTHGRHQIRSGFQYARERQDFIYPGNNGALGYLTVDSLTGAALADFYLGNVIPSSVSASLRDTGGELGHPAQLRGNIYGAYVQDDWRVTNTLTVNLGLRFEDHTPLYDVNNHTVNFGLYTGTIFTATGVDGTAKFGNQALYNNYTGIGDWLPRFGFAWSPAAFNGKTVFRGGFGISQFVEGGGGNEELTQNLPFGFLQQSAAGGTNSLQNGFGSTSAAACSVIDQACYAGNRIRVFDQNFKPAMVDQWNFTVQHQLSSTLTMQIGYVGQRGAHLLNFEDIAQRVGLNAQGTVAQPGEVIVSQRAGPFLGGGNVPCSTTPGAQCGATGSLYAADQAKVSATGAFVCCGTLAGTNMSNADQKYNALQAVLQKRMGTGLEGQVAYTWSKCDSNSPGYFGTGWGSSNAQSSGGQPGWENIYNPRKEWGPCYYDQTHIFTSYVTYQLPMGRGKQFGHDMNSALNAVLGNWEIGGIVTLHSGNALTLNEFGGWGIGGDTSHTGGIEPFTLSGRPNCNGPIAIVNHRVAPSGGQNGFIQWFATNNITDPAPNTFGTCGVGNIRGPGYANADISLHKSFLITEGTRLEFRAEALNAFNHPVWTFNGGPATSPPPGSFATGSPALGEITGSQGARQLQFALKFYF